MESIEKLSLLVLFLFFYLIIINSVNSLIFDNKNLIICYNIVKITKIVLTVLNVWIILLQKKLFRVYGVFFFETLILFLGSLLGFSLMLSFNNLILIYLSIELQSLIFFILSAVQRKIISFDASLKYFIFGIIASLLILYGISVVYGVFSTTDLYGLGVIFELLCDNTDNTDNTNGTGSVVSSFYYCFTFIITGILIKLGAFPFCYWVLQVYNGSLITISAYFSVISYIPYSVLLLNLFIRSHFNLFKLFVGFFYFVCIGSIVFGVLGAFYQTRIKKFIAYNSILNTGFVLLGFLSFFFIQKFTLNALLVLVFLYILSYCLINMGLWGVLLSCAVNNNSLVYLVDFKALYLYNPLLIYLFLMCLISLAGLPPTLGFLIKFFLICSIVKSGFELLAFTVLILSIISVFYFLRLIKMIVFDNYVIKIPVIIFKSFNLYESFCASSALHFIIFYFFYFHFISIFLKKNLIFTL